MNNYKIIYYIDKYENHVSQTPVEELKDMIKGLKKIKSDKNIDMWDCEEYQVLAIKA